MRKQATVYVVNNSGVDFADQFDGEKFLFPALKDGEEPQATEIPVEGAALIFGLGEPDKTRAIQRLGWAATTNDMKGALERLDKFAFHLELPKGHSTAPVVSEEPAIGAQASEAGHSHETAEVAAPPARPARNLLDKLASAGSLRAG